MSKIRNLRSLAEKMRRRPGHFSAVSLFTGLVGFTYIKGPELENPVAKYILAGTTATVAVELGSHVLDSVNMKSKIIQPSFYDGKTVTHVPFYKKVLDKDNMRGYQLVIHGYFVSCMVFFFVQFKSKLITSNALD